MRSCCAAQCCLVLDEIRDVSSEPCGITLYVRYVSRNHRDISPDIRDVATNSRYVSTNAGDVAKDRRTVSSDLGNVTTNFRETAREARQVAVDPCDVTRNVRCVATGAFVPARDPSGIPSEPGNVVHDNEAAHAVLLGIRSVDAHVVFGEASLPGESMIYALESHFRFLYHKKSKRSISGMNCSPHLYPRA
jgi:uncharacterized protein YfcZ (UPF0381/DUF406 family)